MPPPSVSCVLCPFLVTRYSHPPIHTSYIRFVSVSLTTWNFHTLSFLHSSNFSTFHPLTRNTFTCLVSFILSASAVIWGFFSSCLFHTVHLTSSSSTRPSHCSNFLFPLRFRWTPSRLSCRSCPSWGYHPFPVSSCLPPTLSWSSWAPCILSSSFLLLSCLLHYFWIPQDTHHDFTYLIVFCCLYCSLSLSSLFLWDWFPLVVASSLDHKQDFFHSFPSKIFLMSCVLAPFMLVHSNFLPHKVCGHAVSNYMHWGFLNILFFLGCLPTQATYTTFC